MGLSLKQSNAVQALAQCVQTFLPGSGAKAWKSHVTFGTVAAQAGVAEFWTATGSKVPRLIRLFEQTLTAKPQSFEKLIVGIVREGLRYRSTSGTPITPEEIKDINGHIIDIGFKFPDLWDETFLNSLALDDVSRAKANVATIERDRDARASARESELRSLSELKTLLEELAIDTDRQRAGRHLEQVLNRLFDLAGLAPRAPFRVVGEQIDGSFELDDEVYLLEAKWEHAPTPQADLLVFRGKIEGKSSFTRGVFVAMNGVSTEAESAIRIGKQPTFFVVTGHDLMMVLQGALPFREFLRRRRRLLGEEGAVTAAFRRVAG